MKHRLAVLLALVTASAALTVAAPASYAVPDRDCGDFASQRAAQIFFLKHGGPRSDPHGLDAEGDGIACESNPAPYYRKRTLPGSDPKPEKVTVKSTVTLALSRAKAITGEKARLTATVKPRGVRTVAFQRKVGNRWRTMDRDRTNRRGKDSLAIRAPRSTTAYRVVLVKKKAGNKTFTADTSRTRTLTVQKQKVTLFLSEARVAQGERVTAFAEANPVRQGRWVSLQVRQGRGWTTLASEKQSSRGRATFRVPTREADRTTYRAVVHASKGARSEQSRSRDLTVLDVTAPVVPTGVTVAASDGAVEVWWNAVSDRDPVSYGVRYRASGTTTWLRADTWDTSMWLTGLTNETTYEVQVSSLDPSGNRSTWSTVKQVTPTTG